MSLTNEFISSLKTLNEAEMLDISILSAQKYLTSDAKITKFFETPVKVEHKTDGIKCTLIYTGEEDRPFIIAYKGMIIYDGEFQYASKSSLKNKSISNSQFQIIIDHLKNIPSSSIKVIPKDTEFQIEFLMRKQTLSSNYERSHGMVLISHSKTKWSEKFGRLVSNPRGFDISKREEYAKILKIDVPLVLFEGIMGSEKMFENGIKNKDLKDIFMKHRSSLNFSDYRMLLQGITDMFLEVESRYGGKEEGVVLTFNDGLILKIQQSYQVDQVARTAIKDKWRGTPEEEDLYYKQVRLVALDIINHIEIGKNLEDSLKDFSARLKTTKIDFTHPVKEKINIQDDIFNTGKMIITKKLKGNNGALFLGKFRVLSNMHYDIIKKGFAVYDQMVVALVTSTETKETKELRERILKAAFPKLEIVHSTNGNIFTIMNKSNTNINVILAGTDRVAGYKKMIEKNPDLRVREIERTDEDVSASKIIEAIRADNKGLFMEMTPKEIHPFYTELRRVYAGAE